MMNTQPVATTRVETQRLAAGEGFPNNPRLPLLVYRQALGGEVAAGDVQQLFQSHGWGGSWQNGVYGYHHFHSNSHEVLGVCAGSARLQFGGPAGPVLAVAAGDVAVLPAGTGHKCLQASDDFLVVGAYPPGQDDYDLLRGDPAEEAAAARRIAAVPVPATDPVYGASGPLGEHWRDG